MISMVFPGSSTVEDGVRVHTFVVEDLTMVVRFKDDFAFVILYQGDAQVNSALGVTLMTNIREIMEDCIVGAVLP